MPKLFVANFPFSVNDERLKEVFSQAGEVVTAKVMMDHDSGKSRGFGFVEMASDQDASNAISQLNGFNLDGRNIKVTEDRNAGGRPQGGRSFAPREDRRFNNNGPRRDFQNGSQFRQQAAQNDTRRRKKVDPFEEDETLFVDYKDARYLKRFMSERGKILPRRLTGLTSHNQRAVSRAIKRAQHIALLPYSGS